MAAYDFSGKQLWVQKTGPKSEFLAKNSIGEKMSASPSISNGKMYLRGLYHLFFISSK